MTTPTQARIEAALRRARVILANMAQENEGAFFNRWPVNHEPLRADARALVPEIDAALTAAAQVGEHEIMVLKTEKAAWAAECARLQEREAATIERCAQVADDMEISAPSAERHNLVCQKIAAAIRKLREPATDPNIVHTGSDHPGPFSQEEP